MTVEFWIGREYENTHEIKALGEFLSSMIELYAQDDKLYVVLANFFCGGEEVDLAVLKRDGVLIIELKDAGGKVVGGENGNWTVTNPDGSTWTMNSKRSRNPYQQARAYRYAVIDQLRKNRFDFLPRQKAQQMRLDHVTSIVALRPSKHPETDIQVGPFKWFSVVGHDELPQEVYLQRSPILNFRKSELRKLAEVWGLVYYPIDRFVATAGTADSASEPQEAAPQLAKIEDAEPSPDAVAAPDVSWLPAEGTVDPTPGIVDPTQCIVCGYAAEECDVPYLRGRIKCALEAKDDEETTGYLEIVTHDTDSPVLLEVGPSWSELLPLVAAAVDQLAHEPEQRFLTVAAYHLGQTSDGAFAARPESLIILEPDWLINVTDLTSVEYCPRQYLNRHFRLSVPNKYMVRGNIVHGAFQQMVKTPTDEDAIAQGLKSAFFQQASNLALLDHNKDSMWTEVRKPYTGLKLWFDKISPPDTASTETFVLAPQLGLKGKIDALWSRDACPTVVAELKTGQSQGRKPKPGHKLQVAAYSLMAIARMQGQIPELPYALLLYAGNKRLKSSLNIKRKVKLTPDLFREVTNTRNLLVLIDYLADAPFEIRYANKCRKCTIAQDCAAMAALLDHDDPRPPEFRAEPHTLNGYSRRERDWFQTYTALLAKEFRVAKIQHAALWHDTPEDRHEEGTAVIVDSFSLLAEDHDAGEYRYSLQADNQSELREQDIVMVSDLNGPMLGRTSQATITRAQDSGLEIQFRAPLEFKPKHVDKYVTETLVRRQFAGLYLWMRNPPDRDVIIDKELPRFSPAVLESPPSPFVGSDTALNERQLEAVEKVLQMEDYLLIHGPPGSGKTVLIEALVRELLNLDNRVLLAAGTNTAVDNALKVLNSPEFRPHLLRLGSYGRTDPTIRPYTLDALAEQEDLDGCVEKMQTALTSRRIVGATATSWLSGAWDLETFPRFDVAIVDEAAQLTLPAVLGALRLADRFVLIGDHKQLPAVVLSEDNRAISEPESTDEPRLSESLFEQLYAYLQDACPDAIVTLNEQYRMNEEICAIPRQIWYDDDLRPGDQKTANARLALMPQLLSDHSLFSILDPDDPVVFVDVPWDTASRSPRTNEREALLLRDILDAYREHGLSFSSLGVIAPFRAQVATIRRVLQERFPESENDIRGAVDTVDRFQGQEKELIIVSLATYGEFVHDLLRDERRLNVALTRAKHKLIILGDTTVLRAEPAYYSLIHHCTVLDPGSYRRGD